MALERVSPDSLIGIRQSFVTVTTHQPIKYFTRSVGHQDTIELLIEYLVCFYILDLLWQLVSLGMQSIATCTKKINFKYSV